MCRDAGYSKTQSTPDDSNSSLDYLFHLTNNFSFYQIFFANDLSVSMYINPFKSPLYTTLWFLGQVISPFVSSFKLGSFTGPVIQANESSVVIFSIVVDFVVVTIGCSTVGVVDLVVLLVVGVDDVTVVVVVVVLLVVDVTVVVLIVVSDVVDGFSVLVTRVGYKE